MKVGIIQLESITQFLKTHNRLNRRYRNRAEKKNGRSYNYHFKSCVGVDACCGLGGISLCCL